MLKEFGRGLEVAQNLLVLRCDPGAAPGMGRVIDELDHELILGCVAGDDTVILVSKDLRVGRGRLRVPHRTGRMKHMSKEKCVLAYSGGLDTSALDPVHEGEVRLRHHRRAGGRGPHEGRGGPAPAGAHRRRGRVGGHRRQGGVPRATSPSRL